MSEQNGDAFLEGERGPTGRMDHTLSLLGSNVQELVPEVDIFQPVVSVGKFDGGSEC